MARILFFCRCADERRSGGLFLTGVCFTVVAVRGLDDNLVITVVKRGHNGR